jgi:hypothetical protein
MTTLTELIELSDWFDRSKVDDVAAGNQITIDASLKLHTARFHAGGELELTEHAWGQLAKRLAPAVFGRGSQRTLPMAYLRALPPAMMAAELNYWLERVNGNGFLVRSYENTCRALLDGRYPTIDNSTCLRSLNEMAADPENAIPGAWFDRCFVSSDHVIVRMLYLNTHQADPGNDGSLWCGVQIQNDEIGQGRLRCHGILWNGGCTNSIRLVDGIEITHQFRNIGAGVWMENQLKGALGQIMQSTPAFMERLITAQTKKLPALGAIIGKLAAKHDWKPDFTSAVGVGSRGQETVAGLLNGLTYAAQTLENPVDQVHWEALAGEYLEDDSGLFAMTKQLAKGETADIVVRN